MSHEILTTRTRLRRLRASDLAAIHALESDPDITKWTPMRVPQSLKQSQARLESHIEKEAQNEPFGVWVAETKSDQELVGWFMLLPRDLEFPELGFMIARAHWRTGLSFEIAQALIQHAWNQLGLKGISARTNIDNIASIGVLKKLGFLESHFMNTPEDAFGQSLKLRVFVLKPNDELTFIRYNDEIHADLLAPLTDLLHRAYAPLAAQGLNYVATHQPASKTQERLLEGEGYLVFAKGQLVGTVTLYKEDPTSSCEYYRTPGVYAFGQFAIDPDHQGKGWGDATMKMIEQRARDLRAREMALDTSEHATELIRMYESRGYLNVAYTQWAVTNYRSVIMSKALR